MIAAPWRPLPGARASSWLFSVGLGVAIGLSIVALHRLGLGSPFAAVARDVVDSLNASIGPVWVAMVAVAARVAWLGARAGRSRRGRGATGIPVRPELLQLAPIFAALGLCGTVWGLSTAFDALQHGEFLQQLPVLLGGLGAAMTSTLVGLGLQIGTLLLAAFNPSWSLVRVAIDDGQGAFWLDGAPLGRNDEGLEGLLEAIGSRQPEALRLEFGSSVQADLRARVRGALWRRSDGAMRIREASV